MTNETFGDRLLLLRRARGESLRQAAPGIGCAYPHLAEMERGVTDNPTLATLRALARYYNVTVAYLVGEAP